jgi:HAD superfamily hydrolase (TIGR01509 family)
VSAIAAVVFDLDGVVIQSEEVWARVRRRFVEETGGTWTPSAQRDLMGLSPAEWQRYLRERLGVPLAPAEISRRVVAMMAEEYRRSVPLIPGAVEAVRSLSGRWPLGVASSSDRPLIDLVLGLAGLSGCFEATVSSEEVARGKPAPDVYLEACRRLAAAPERTVAIEDSSAGIGAALSAGMRVIAIPNPSYPPPPEALGRAHVVLGSIRELGPRVVEGI